MGNSKSRPSCLRMKYNPNKTQAKSNSTTTAPISEEEVSPKSGTGFENVRTNLPQAVNRNKVPKRNSIFLTTFVADVRVKYRVEAKEIGRGHYGVVRRCQNRTTGEWFAIKTIRKMRVRRLETLRTEIQILQTLNHPNIIKLIDVFEDEKFIHLVQELCTGGELFDRIIEKTKTEEGHYSESDASHIVKKILETIAYCHDHHVCHRDLKPENFIFKSPDECSDFKIIDFGLSNIESKENEIMTTKVGTPFYIAPEVLSKNYTKACDLWSVGVIMYILLSGYPPFWGESDYEIFEKVKTDKVRFPTTGWKNISEEAKDLILQLLNKNYLERPSVREALCHPWFKENNKGKKLQRRASLPGRLRQYVGLSKFQKHAVNFIANQLTENEIGHLRSVFEEFDQNGDGHITMEELWAALESEGMDQEALKKQAKEIMHGIDLDGSQTIDYCEFIGAAADRNLCIREENISMAFRYFDKQGAGYITATDLVDIFGTLPHAQEAINAIDLDGNGVLTYDEFKKMVQLSDSISI